GLNPLRVRWIPRPVVPALVEGKKPGFFALEMGAKSYFLIINGEMDKAAAKMEEQLVRITVQLVLSYRIIHRLFGKAILQLESCDRQTIDEESEVERQLSLVFAIAELSRDAKLVGGKQLDGLRITRRGCAIKEGH